MKVILAAVLMGGLLTACTNQEQNKKEENMTTLNLTQEWDKVFPLSEKVNHCNKQLLIIPGASHCDLYDGGYTELVGKGEPKNLIPWDKLADFFKENLK